MAVEKINLEISQKKQYIDWLDNTNTKGNVRNSLRSLKANRRSDEWEWLSRHVLVTLFCANQYSPKDDRFNRNTNERLKNLESELTCISKFNKLIKKDSDFGVRFFLHACVPQNSLGKILFNIPHGQYDSVFKTAFRDYKASLKKEISTLRRYRKKMLVACGGLLYPEFNEGGSKNRIRDIRLYSKLFHLTYIFRCFTYLKDKKLDLGTQEKKMPLFGDPRYDLTALILKENQENIKKIVPRLAEKGVYIKPWPVQL